MDIKAAINKVSTATPTDVAPTSMGEEQRSTENAVSAPNKDQRDLDYTDGRELGDWNTRYPREAKRCINQEACVLIAYLAFFTFFSGVFLGLAGERIELPYWFVERNYTYGPTQPTVTFRINFSLISTFFIGGLGGTTFSIKWLIHSAAKRKWNLDRRYWRLFVPMIGGVYACVVLALFDTGLIGGHNGSQPRPLELTAAFAFLVGYFSDGVSGLLSNIANAVFGTLEKK